MMMGIDFANEMNMTPLGGSIPLKKWWGYLVVQPT
jgi:hypothetical protein